MKQLKRLLSFLLASSLAVGTLPGALAAGGVGEGNPFTDVKSTDWFYPAVQYAYSKGIMSGTSADRFSPDVTTTRGMVVTMLHRMEGAPAAYGANFVDVGRSQYYTDAVAWASANGIVSGYSNGSFGADDVITREQMASVLYRYSEYRNLDTKSAAALSGFSDADQINSYAVNAMAWAVENGLISGNGHGQLAPQESASRAQIASVLMRYDQTFAAETEAAGEDGEASAEASETFTVTFHLNYGSSGVYRTVKVASGDTVKFPSEPSRSGYDFDGWYADSDCKDKFDKSTPITADITLYAAWDQSASGSTGSSGSGSGYSSYGEGGQKGHDGYGGQGSGSHSAGGAASASGYTVVFDSMGGSAVESKSVPAGERVPVPETPVRENYAFVGWYQTADYSKEFSFGEIISGNMRLYARWVDLKDTADSDGDGLTDPAEAYFGTDPNKADTDGDGLTDYFEVLYALDPLVANAADLDSDRDGLTDLEEQKLGTDPLLTDTDADGLSDYDEVRKYMTDPTKADTDGDGLSDYEEIQLGLDPLKEKSDGRTKDAERAFIQKLDEENISISKDSETLPSLVVETVGYVNSATVISEATEAAVTGSKAIVGSPIEIISGIDLSEAKSADLSFEITDTSTLFEESTDSDVTENLVICRYTKEKGFVPLDTKRAGNKLTATIGEAGVYFVLDVEAFLMNLDVDALSVFEESKTSLLGMEDVVDHPSISERRALGNRQSLDEAEEEESVSLDDSETETESISLDDSETEPADESEAETDSADESESESEAETDSADESEETSDEVPMEVTEVTLEEEEELARAADAGYTAKAQADIVFIIDATGSMSSAIRNVETNVNRFADQLVNEYKINANFALIEFQDITFDGPDSTILHRNGRSGWWNAKSVEDFQRKVNAMTAKNGGDWAETPLDGLGMARNLVKSSSTQKFFVLITDAPYKQDNRYGVADMDEMIALLKEDEINVSVITDVRWDFDHWESSEEGDVIGYRDLYEETHGLFGNIYGNFAETLRGIAEMINKDVHDGSWIMLDDFTTVKLSKPLTEGSANDTDGDGLTDLEELGAATTIDLTAFIRILLEEAGYSMDEYLAKGGKTSIPVYSYRSRPDMADTDGDGMDDKSDPHPLEWDVCDRDLAMCAALCYEDGTAAKSEGRFYEASEIIGDSKGTEVGQSYYFYGLADIEEMEDNWKVVDYTEDSRVVKIDNFSATTFKNGSNVIIAYRGTNETLEWLDNILCYGLADYHTEEAQARAYARKIARRYPDCDIYITGHSLGGYLAQIGTAELHQEKLSGNLVKTAYFNGIGMAFNPSLAILKAGDMLALYDFSHDVLTSKHNLISYAIKGDWVHNLGSHQGDKEEFFAAEQCVEHHKTAYWEAYGDLSGLEKVGKALVSYGVSALGLPLFSVAASPATVYYYAYYGVPDFVSYTWITHETDSFFAHLKRGA